ncbi:MAG: DNA-directed RNA polymerase subunit omega [Eubacteriales bacterium]|nr:DNA-directed RNA polymerase subunit omega [Eubacteriales bacterium]
MLRPSYTDLINAVNSEVEPGEHPVVQSRYSIVLATAKRARQIIGGEEPMVAAGPGKKPLSVAVQELYRGKVKIVGEDAEDESVLAAIAESESAETTSEFETVDDEEEREEEEAERQAGAVSEN